jgi:hypothetical protein
LDIAFQPPTCGRQVYALRAAVQRMLLMQCCLHFP